MSPRPVILPDPAQPNALFVANDVDRAREEIGANLLHDARTYAVWNTGDSTTASLSFASSVEDLRAANGSHRIVDVAGAMELIRTYGYLSLHPTCGGIQPEIAWPYLKRSVTEVLPAAAALRCHPALAPRSACISYASNTAVTAHRQPALINTP